ncbi:OmpA family protein [Pelagibius litoralis]|uniref:OmpA family protein n=1 Tax=Pelagibius litoralis TaxID=374515 RepID=A0A967C1U3_9PROT|nr:OmpA family protein [Pelagibius litoralis]NIA67073.1 OmpA family protein [Pelagibius litoralis]
MTEFQDAMGQASTTAGRTRRYGPVRMACFSVGFAAFFSLAGCTAVDDLTTSPEERAAQQPQKVTTEGVKDEFPNLAEVPSEPKPHTPPETREEIVSELTDDRSKASFTDPTPLITAAPKKLDPFASATIISADSVTTSTQFAGLSSPTETGPGQLAAIIFFNHGSVVLDENDLGVLRDLVTLHEQRGGRLRVIGHASSRTQNATPDEHQVANFEMSLERANVVSAELLSLGVSPDALATEAKADAEPVYHEFMPSGEAGNRRVEIFLEK